MDFDFREAFLVDKIASALILLDILFKWYDVYM